MAMTGAETSPECPSLDDEFLEFFSIKVADGPLTSRLQLIRPGDRVLASRKPTGTLAPHDPFVNDGHLTCRQIARWRMNRHVLP